MPCDETLTRAFEQQIELCAPFLKLGSHHIQICDHDQLTNILNGKAVNHAYKSSHTEGKIQLQSEGAEILIRRVELQPLTKSP